MRGVWVGALLFGAISSLAGPSSAQNKPYKGGELYSQQEYLYGRIEVRMRMARGSGILSTFFTYKDGSEIDGTFWEEIDIEVFGKDDATAWQSNIITGLGTRTTSEEEHHYGASLADAYHTYALEWAPDYVAWEMDGQEVRRTTTNQVQDLVNPQSLRFNIWAANIESWVGPFDTAALPAYQFVNWISYYRYENGSFVHEWTDEFDSLDEGRWGRADWTFAENLADFDPNNVVVQDGTLVLALTNEGMTGFTGTVPVDSDVPPATGGASGTGGADGTGGTIDTGTGGTIDTGSGGASSGGASSGGASSGGADSPGTGGQVISSAGGQTGDPLASGGDGAVGNPPGTGGDAPVDQGGDADSMDDGAGCSCSQSPRGSGGSGGLWLSLVLLSGAFWRRVRAQRAARAA